MSEDNFENFTERFIQRGLLSRILQSNSILGGYNFWLGNTINFIRYHVEKSTFFGINSAVQMFTNPTRYLNSSKIKGISAKYMLGSSIASLIVLGFFYHLEYAYLRLVNDSTNQFTGLLDVYLKTVTSNGITGLYHGFLFSYASVVAYRLSFYVSTNILITTVMSNQALSAVFFIMPVAPVALFFITCTSAVLTHPLFVIQKQMIMASQGVTEAYMDTVKNGGLALWSGIGGTFLRTILGQTIILAVNKIDLLLSKFISKRKN